MLARPPRYRITSVVLCGISIFALYLLLSALWTINMNAHSHGTRKAYLFLKDNVQSGQLLGSEVLIKREIFSNDAPNGAIEFSNSPTKLYAKNDLNKNSYLTKTMVVNSLDKLSDDDQRIIFIPTTDLLDKNISNKTDLLSFSESGFGAETVANSATILFNDNKSSNNYEKSKGYFVLVSSEEALSISQAIGQGEIHFSLIPKDN